MRNTTTTTINPTFSHYFQTHGSMGGMNSPLIINYQNHHANLVNWQLWGIPTSWNVGIEITIGAALTLAMIYQTVRDLRREHAQQ